MENENINNMRKCPRFESCSIPKCSLDFYMEERTQLPGDEVCPMMRFIGKCRSKRMKGRILPKLMDIVKTTNKKRQSSDKITNFR